MLQMTTGSPCSFGAIDSCLLRTSSVVFFKHEVYI